MAVSDSIETRITKFEGNLSYIYQDDDGNPTVGIGHLLATADDAVKLPFIKTASGLPATEREIKAEWTKIRAGTKKNSNGVMHLKSDSIQALLKEDLAKTRAGLKDQFDNFDSFPESAQAGLMDMAFNMGPGWAGKFPTMTSLLQAPDIDWLKVAKESHRLENPPHPSGVQPARNAEVKALFEKAAKKKETDDSEKSKPAAEPTKLAQHKPAASKKADDAGTPEDAASPVPPATPAVGASALVNALTVVHANSMGLALGFPDPCNTPMGPAVVPIPYPNIAMSQDTAQGSQTVQVDGNPIMLKGSFFAQSTGDEPGVAGGLMSGVTKGKAEFINYSFDVKVEGANVPRLGDSMVQNKGGSANTPPSPEIQPLSVVVPGQKPKNKCRVRKMTLKSGNRSCSKQYVLEVVGNKKIELSAEVIKSCDAHPKWTIDGFEAMVLKGAEATLAVEADKLSGDFKANAEVHEYAVTLHHCAGMTTGLVRVYTGDKINLEAAPDKWRAAYGAVSIGLELNIARYLKPMKTADESADEWSKENDKDAKAGWGFFEKGKLKIEWGWKESDDHTVFNAYELAFESDPLVRSRALRFIYGPSAALPEFLRDYAAAGIYAQAQGQISASGKWVKKNGGEGEAEVSVKGAIKFKAGVILFLLSADVISFDANGTTGLTLELKNEKVAERPALSAELRLDAFETTITFSVVFGILAFECKHKFFEEITFPLGKWPLPFTTNEING